MIRVAASKAFSITFTVFVVSASFERLFVVLRLSHESSSSLKNFLKSLTAMVYLRDDANKHDDIGTSSELTLSFGDTLYLHPNDTGGSSIVTIKLTSTENYKM
ncbi:hypothetical protein Tco_0933242 [Tanacetum coccineum]